MLKLFKRGENVQCAKLPNYNFQHVAEVREGSVNFQPPPVGNRT